MSKLEDTLHQQIRYAGLSEPQREFYAIEGRRFRFDFCWPLARLLVEVQGGVWAKGGHTSGVGINRDAEKANLATLAGYRVLTVTSNQVKSGKALAWIQEALGRAA